MNASEALKYLRTSRNLDEQVLKNITMFDFVNEMNNIITSSDKEMVLRLCAGETPEERRLGIALSRGLHHEPDIQEVLLQMWNTEQHIRVRSMLLWFLLDYEDLPSGVRESIYDFIKQNWDAFEDQCVGYSGGGERLLKIAKSRISDEFFPPTKIFAYLCAAFISPNRNEVRSFLESFTSHDDSLTRRVANDLLERL